MSPIRSSPGRPIHRSTRVGCSKGQETAGRPPPPNPVPPSDPRSKSPTSSATGISTPMAAGRLKQIGSAAIPSAKTLTKAGAGTLHTPAGISGSASSTLLIQQGTVEAKYFNGFVTQFSAGGRASVIPDGTIAATSKLTLLDFAGASGAWQ